jgi:hypothetical protein
MSRHDSSAIGRPRADWGTRERIVGVPRVFGEPGDMVLLGAHSLEGLNLRVDPAARRLVPAMLLLLNAGQHGSQRRRAFAAEQRDPPSAQSAPHC